MKRFHFKLVVGTAEISKVAESNSKATAVTAVMNLLTPEQQEDFVSLEIYAEQEVTQ